MTSEVLDRRQAPRMDVKLDAFAADESGILFECTILDINAFGARLRVSGPVAADEFYLVDVLAAVAYRARIQWRKSPLVGTRFSRAVELEPDGPYAWLRKHRQQLLIEQAARRGIRVVSAA